MKKVKLEKKTQKDFGQGTVIIQTPSFTTSKGYGYLLLCKLPLSKNSIFKISETLQPHGSASLCTVVAEFAGHTGRSQQKTVYNTSVRVSLSRVDCPRAMELPDSDDSRTESIFVLKS